MTLALLRVLARPLAKLPVLGAFSGRLGMGLVAASVTVPALAVPSGPQVVIELFTSQSCSSCPPAERLLAKLNERGRAIGLEWHVDYWDDLVAGRRGRWQDPYSAPAFTRRQRDYNRRLRGTRAVYTPQMVIGGQAELPGFREARVEKLVRAQARDLDAFSGTITRVEEGGWRLSLDGPVPLSTTLWRVDVIAAASTAVAKGENQGKTLDNHNIVRDFTDLGPWRGGPKTLDLPVAAVSGAVSGPGAEPVGCVILVQEPDLGRVLFGLACPVAN